MKIVKIMEIGKIMEEFMECIERAFAEMSLGGLLITFLVAVTICSLMVLLPFEIVYSTNIHSKSENNEKERNILQDKDNDKN